MFAVTLIIFIQIDCEGRVVCQDTGGVWHTEDADLH